MQILQAPLPFKPGEEMMIPEDLEYIAKIVIPWFWSF
jgi:hypothetical protein